MTSGQTSDTSVESMLRYRVNRPEPDVDLSTSSTSIGCCYFNNYYAVLTLGLSALHTFNRRNYLNNYYAVSTLCLSTLYTFNKRCDLKNYYAVLTLC